MRLREFDEKERLEKANEKLGKYKTAAGADAAAADASGNFTRGNTRFKGINRATKKQFANDAKLSQLKEFAPSGDDGDGFGEEILKRLAAQWWNNDEDPRVEQTLMSAGWEIGQDDGYDNGGVFVVQAGDDQGDSYISWPAEELQMNEVAPPGARAERMVRHIKQGYARDGKLTPREKGIAFATAWKAHNAGQVEEATEDEYQDDYEDEETELCNGCYVRDKEDSSGEIFVMRGDPGDRRVRIEDRHGRGWNIAPYRLTVVDDSDPDIAAYFGDELDEAGVAEGEYDSRKPFGVRYKVFAGREGRMTTREYWTSSEEKLQRAVEKIQALDNFYEIDGYSYPKESQGVAENKAAGINKMFNNLGDPVYANLQRVALLAMQGRQSEAAGRLQTVIKHADPAVQKKITDAVNNIKPVMINGKVADSSTLDKSKAHQDWTLNTFIPWVQSLLGQQDVTEAKTVEFEGVAEGWDKLTPQQKAHEYNLDAAQKEMDRRHAQGEDMTGAKIDKKTYKIVKPKKKDVAEGVTSPEIKQAYNAIMQTTPRSPERRAAIAKYQKLRADAVKNKQQGVAEGLTEMDKSEPSAGRDTGPRPGPDREAKPITAKKATRDAGRMLNRAFQDSHKKKDVKEATDSATSNLIWKAMNYLPHDRPKDMEDILVQIAHNQGPVTRATDDPKKLASLVQMVWMDGQARKQKAGQQLYELSKDTLKDYMRAQPARIKGPAGLATTNPKKAARIVNPEKGDMRRALTKLKDPAYGQQGVAEDSIAAMRRLAGIVTPTPAVVSTGPRQYRHMPTAVQPR